MAAQSSEPDIEEIDLAALAAALERALGGAPPMGYLEGRTAFRDAVAAHLHCSDATAEDLVDTMESRGFLRFEGDKTRADANDAGWTITVAP